MCKHFLVIIRRTFFYDKKKISRFVSSNLFLFSRNLPISVKQAAGTWKHPLLCQGTLAITVAIMF